MHYYTFNIGDYASHTKGLSLLEDLAYRRLLDAYYLAERPLNGCPADVARSIGMRDQVEEVTYVLKTFFSADEQGNWVNSRADKIIKSFVSKSESAARAGRASAERRLNKRSTDVEQTLNERQLTKNQEPITNNQEPIEVPNGTRQRETLTPAAPIEEIVNLYNEKLPMLPRVTVVNDSRKRAISARWREVVTADKLDRQGGLDFFAWYFGMVGQSKFLTGKAKDWKADIDFLFNPSKFPRVVEGFYHKEQA